MIPGFKKSAFSLNDILMYLALARKYFRLMVLLMSFALTVGLTYYVYARPVYYSRSLIRVETFALPLDTEKIFKDSAIKTIRNELTAMHIVERTARKLGLIDNEGNERQVMKRHLKKLAVSFTSEGDFQLEVWPYTVKLAREWPETMLQEYLDYRDEQRAKYRETSIKKLTQTTTEINEKIVELMGAKHNFLNQNDLLKSDIELKELRFVNKQWVANKRRLAVYENTAERLSNPNLTIIQKLALLFRIDRELQVGVGEFVEGVESMQKDNAAATGQPATQGLVVIPSMINPAMQTWQTLEKEQLHLLQAKAELEEKFKPAHPQMQAIQEKLDEVEKGLQVELRSAENRFNLEYASLKETQASLDKKLPEYWEALKRDEMLNKDFDQYKLMQLPWNSHFANASRQLATIDFAGEKERTTMQFMGVVELRDLPVSPHRLKLVIYSLLLGLALIVGVPLLIEYLDNTVSKVEQAELEYQIRALGIVPQVFDDDKMMTAQSHVISDKPNRHLLENFRVIRTNLVYSGSANPAHVILVASALPQEGKSVVATNLAISFAQMGEKTLLIDADLRRGRLHRSFNCTSRPGLSHVLMGQASPEEALHPTQTENLVLLPYGEHIEGVTEMLGSPNCGKLMASLRPKFQRIIIDTPPVLGLSDTSMLLPLVDGVVYVIWSGRTNSRSLKTAVNTLKDNGANFYGFVLNRLDLSDSANYYQYYYYSYNYYENYQLAEKTT